MCVLTSRCWSDSQRPSVARANLTNLFAILAVLLGGLGHPLEAEYLRNKVRETPESITIFFAPPPPPPSNILPVKPQKNCTAVCGLLPKMFHRHKL
eukprot:6314482-Amphidinium_carterae.1